MSFSFLNSSFSYCFCLVCLYIYLFPVGFIYEYSFYHIFSVEISFQTCHLSIVAFRDVYSNLSSHQTFHRVDPMTDLCGSHFQFILCLINSSISLFDKYEGIAFTRYLLTPPSSVIFFQESNWTLFWQPLLSGYTTYYYPSLPWSQIILFFMSLLISVIKSLLNAILLELMVVLVSCNATVTSRFHNHFHIHLRLINNILCLDLT